MAMRWYQHKVQIGSPITSPRNNAPSVDSAAISHAAKSNRQAAESGVLKDEFMAGRTIHAAKVDAGRTANRSGCRI